MREQIWFRPLPFSEEQVQELRWQDSTCSPLQRGTCWEAGSKGSSSRVGGTVLPRNTTLLHRPLGNAEVGSPLLLENASRGETTGVAITQAGQRHTEAAQAASPCLWCKQDLQCPPGLLWGKRRTRHGNRKALTTGALKTWGCPPAL